MFDKEKAAEIETRWDDLASSLAERLTRAEGKIIETRDDVLAFRNLSDQYGRKVWSTNHLEPVDEEINSCIRVVVTFPNDAAITRLISAVTLMQDEKGQLEGLDQLETQIFKRNQRPSINTGERLDMSIAWIHG